MIIEITDDNFQQEVLSRPNLVVVIAHTAPIDTSLLTTSFIRIKSMFQGFVVAGKLDANASQITARKYAIKGFIMYLFFQNGELKGKYVSSITPQQSVGPNGSELLFSELLKLIRVNM